MADELDSGVLGIREAQIATAREALEEIDIDALPAVIGEPLRRALNALQSQMTGLAVEADAYHHAHQTATAHLEGCMAALYESDEGYTPGSPALAAFDGCTTCITREVLGVALPIIEASLQLQREDLP